jgi:formate--tetrahydrofolate ligase
MDPALLENNPAAVTRGAANLAKHLDNVHAYGVPAVVAINVFPTDTREEIAALRQAALAAGASDAVESTHFVDGGEGAKDLARAVWAAAQTGAPDFRLLYPDDAPLREKIETIATRIYGADGVDFLPAAARALSRYENLGYGHLPICMAKTQYSLSHDPSLLGRPTGFRVPVRDVTLAAGAGFVTALCGDMRTMPGLNSRPGGERIDIDADDNVIGLF